MNAIEVSHLTKSFGELKAVDDLSLTVPKGEIFGLLGPNGAGKTTLIHSVIGVYRIDEGTIRVLGHPIPKEKLEARKKNWIYASRSSDLFRPNSQGQFSILRPPLRNVGQSYQRKNERIIVNA